MTVDHIPIEMQQHNRDAEGCDSVITKSHLSLLSEMCYLLSLSSSGSFMIVILLYIYIYGSAALVGVVSWSNCCSDFKLLKN